MPMHRRFFDICHDMLAVASTDGVFTQVNGSWTRELGWSAEELTSRPYVDFVHPDDRARTEEETASLREGNVTIGFRNRYRTVYGDYRWLEWRSVLDPETNLVYGAARDVLPEVHRAIRDREAMLTDLVSAQLAARDDEHRRIAHELHDSSVQHSVAALVLMEALEGAELPAAAAEIVDRAREQVRASLTATRRVMQGLDTLDADHPDLEYSLRSLAAELAGIFGVRVDVEAQLASSWPVEVQRTAYRVAREALTNAAKHSGASRVRVVVREAGACIEILVVDDGGGMAAPVLAGAGAGQSGERGTGLGLALMRERVRIAGGDLEFRDEDPGTAVRALLPREPVGFDARLGARG